MAEYKNVVVDVDWVSRIDGHTVKEAIEYLSTLEQELLLNVWMDGDTHGVSLESNLLRRVEKTEIEILQDRRRHWLMRKEEMVQGKNRYISLGYTSPERLQGFDRLIEDYDRKASECEVKIEEARKKTKLQDK